MEYRLYCFTIFPAVCFGREQVFLTELCETNSVCLSLRNLFHCYINARLQIIFHTSGSAIPLFATLSIHFCWFISLCVLVVGGKEVLIKGSLEPLTEK